MAFTAVAVGLYGCGSKTSQLDPAGATTYPTTGPTASLTVRVIDLRNRKGHLVFGVFRAAAGFPSDKEKSVAWDTQTADADSIVFTTRLPPGVYSASILHDQNSNGKMDTRFGIPSEGYGVTNNPKPKFRAARFDEATFTLPPEGKTVEISVQYF